MARFIKHVSEKTGQIPGAVIHAGERKTEKVKITVIDYNEKNLREKVTDTVEECFPFKNGPTVTWINIDGLHDTGVIEKIGEHFDLHPLILEDIADTGKRPGVEDSGSYIFLALKMLYNDRNTGKMVIEHVSIILGENYVISFQEREGDVFGNIRERIRKSKGRIRKMGADYLAYTLIDAIVDNYFLILEKFEERIEDMEEGIATDPTMEDLKLTRALKKEAMFMRRSVWPLRGIIGYVERGESKLIKKPPKYI